MSGSGRRGRETSLRCALSLTLRYVAGQDRFFYLCSVIDVFDRSILGYHIGWTCTAKQALRALQAAVAARRSDWPPAQFYRWALAGTAPDIKAVHC